MHRLKLTWLASEGGTVAQTTATFRIMLCITIVYQVLHQFLKWLPIAYIDTSDNYARPKEGYYTVVDMQYFLIITFWLFTMSLVCRTRRRVRERYSIPEKQCRGVEDCCCAFFCGCCTAAQMARHTADYETYAGQCCSETGVPAHAPSIV